MVLSRTVDVFTSLGKTYDMPVFLQDNGTLQVRHCQGIQWRASVVRLDKSVASCTVANNLKSNAYGIFADLIF